MLKNFYTRYLNIFYNFDKEELFGLFLINGLNLNKADISFKPVSIPVK